MCIIVSKPEGVKFPSKSTLQECFRNNPDGAGFMYQTAAGVHISKGFMTFKSFWSALRETRQAVGDDVAYVLHFRITTQGGTRPDCCHPFPLSRSMDDLRELETIAEIGVAHNGIIELTSSHRKGITHSDTMEFITDYLSLIIKKRTYYKDPDTMTLIFRLCGSRLAILDSYGHIEHIGTGWLREAGVWYSNSSYMAPKSFKYYDDLFDYDYKPESCPFTMEGDDSYCIMCSSFETCWS